MPSPRFGASTFAAWTNGEQPNLRWNHRQSLEIDDNMRARAIIKAAEGKRLTYRRIGGENSQETP